jgi:hypothetical protein
MSIDLLPALRLDRVAWIKGRIVGQKRPLMPRHLWSIRVRLEMAGNARDLALGARWSMPFRQLWRSEKG